MGAAMKYAVKSQGGQWRGVVYDTIAPNIVAHHAQYGETLHPVAGLNNTGTDDAPVWHEAEMPEAGRASFAADAIDAHVDAQARALKYTSAASLASYTDSSVAEWRAEAQTFIAWRDDVWQAWIAMADDPPATVSAVLSALPPWPGV